jgi:hypothetical protein
MPNASALKAVLKDNALIPNPNVINETESGFSHPCPGQPNNSVGVTSDYFVSTFERVLSFVVKSQEQQYSSP